MCLPRKKSMVSARSVLNPYEFLVAGDFLTSKNRCFKLLMTATKLALFKSNEVMVMGSQPAAAWPRLGKSLKPIVTVA